MSEHGGGIMGLNGRSGGCAKNRETRIKGASVVLRDDKGFLHAVERKPAVVNDNGVYEAYWVHGRRHRVSGPAIIDGNSHKKFWYYFGKLVAINEKVALSFDFEKNKGVVVLAENEEANWRYKKVEFIF